MRKIIGTIAAVGLLGLAGCAGQITSVISQVSGANNQMISDITEISNAFQPDLLNAQATAMTINPLTGQPFDQAVADCIGKGILPVKASVDVLLAAAKGAGNGLLTDAVVTGIVQPGGANFEAAKQTLLQGCAAAAVEHNVDAVNSLNQLVPILATAAVVSPVK